MHSEWCTVHGARCTVSWPFLLGTALAQDEVMNDDTIKLAIGICWEGSLRKVGVLSADLEVFPRDMRLHFLCS